MNASKKSFIRLAGSTPRLRLSDSLFGAEYPRLAGTFSASLSARGSPKKSSMADARPATAASGTPWPRTWMNPTRPAGVVDLAGDARAGVVVVRLGMDPGREVDDRHGEGGPGRRGLGTSASRGVATTSGTRISTGVREACMPTSSISCGKVRVMKAHSPLGAATTSP